MNHKESTIVAETILQTDGFRHSTFHAEATFSNAVSRMSHISEIIRLTRPNSLLVGTLQTTDREGAVHLDTCIEGTPHGFRMLANVLLELAGAVEEGASQDDGWGVSLSPELHLALRTHGVRNVTLSCQPIEKFDMSNPDE